MDSFEQKIYNLTQKLHNIPTKAPQHNPPTPQHLLQLTTSLSQNIQQKQEELQRRCVSLIQSLTLYESELNKLINKCQSDVQKIGEENASFVENVRIQRSQKREELGKIQKKVVCEMEERIDEDRCQFEIQVKNIKKEIKKELGLLQKQIKSLNENPQLQFLSSDNRVYKDYYLKVSIIEQNQRKKAEKINEIQTKVRKRIEKMHSNISNSILCQENELKSKYSKLKRLFALITDIS